MDKAPCVLSSGEMKLRIMIYTVSFCMHPHRCKAASKLDNGGVWMIQQMFGRCC
ncbi:hypothetical protein NC652_026054 [Populus alba x Populus x berolinensis]|nr:hypothetical protein NC652_026054 [Populus alba x Populus x berolinensis]